MEQMTASQISSNKQELSSIATSENKLESVNNLKACFLFQGQSTKNNQASSQISSNNLELSYEATPKLKPDLVNNRNASLQFQRQIREDKKRFDQEKTENITASQMSRNKQELCPEATPKIKNDNQKLLILHGQEAIYPEGTENKIASHTGNDNNQLELDFEITCYNYLLVPVQVMLVT